MAITNIHPRSAVAGTADTNALRDIKPPVEIPSGWAWLWWGLLVLAVAALAFLAWFMRRRNHALAPDLEVWGACRDPRALLPDAPAERSPATRDISGGSRRSSRCSAWSRRSLPPVVTAGRCCWVRIPIPNFIR